MRPLPSRQRQLMRKVLWFGVVVADCVLRLRAEKDKETEKKEKESKVETDSDSEACEVSEFADYLASLPSQQQPSKEEKTTEKKEEKPTERSEDKKEEKTDGKRKYKAPKDSDWVTVTTDFSVVWAMNVTHAASDMHTAPFAHWADGCMDLCWVGRTGCCPLLSMFLNMETGQHTSSEVLEYTKVRAFRLVPSSSRELLMGVDGERVPMKPIDVRCFRGVVNLLCL